MNLGFADAPTRVEPGDPVVARRVNALLQVLHAALAGDRGTRLQVGALASDTQTLLALGSSARRYGGVWLDGQALLPRRLGRGIHLVVLDGATRELKHRAAYDTAQSTAAARRLADDLRAQAAPRDLVSAVTHGPYLDNLGAAASAALAAVGAAALAEGDDDTFGVAFVGVVPPGRPEVGFDAFVSRLPGGLAFAWGLYSRPLQRFVLGGAGPGTLGRPLTPSAPALLDAAGSRARPTSSASG